MFFIHSLIFILSVTYLFLGFMLFLALGRDFGKRSWIDVDVVELKKLDVVEFEVGVILI